jgi:hypothetical protein
MTGERISLHTASNPETTLLARIYPSISPSDSTDAPSTTDATDNAPDRPADDSFPFLDDDRSQWNVPCPYCESQIHNTRDAFITHWTQADKCDGPDATPPTELQQLTHSAWDDIVTTVESQTTAQQAHTENTSPATSETQDEQPRSLDTDLDIQNSDGTYPWLRFPDKGWKVSCPYCDENIFNSEDAFTNHWRDSEQCPADDQTIAKLTDHADPASTPTPGTDRSNKLATLFEKHLNRADHTDHWINLTFENNGQTDAHYQYLNGSHNLTRLTPTQKEALEATIDEYGLTVESDGDNYMTVTSGTQQPDIEVNLCLSLLRSVYNTTIEDITQAAEHDAGFQAW